MTDGRLFAIGDVHGCPGELEALVEGLQLQAGDTVCFVGDYIDRGRDSKGVIDLLLDARRRADVRWVFLKGNHEDMCLSYLGRSGNWGESWMGNGGVAAVRSYGVDARSAPAAIEAAMPETHLAFLDKLERSFRWGGYLFVHAGIRPGVPGTSRPTRTCSGSARVRAARRHAGDQRLRSYSGTPAVRAAALQDRHRHRAGLRRCAHRARAAGPRAAPGDGGRASRARQRVAGQSRALIPSLRCPSAGRR